MRFLIPVAAVAAAALSVAACDKPRTQSAYINSGTSATPAMPAQQAPAQSPVETVPQPMTSQAAPAGLSTSQAPAVSDTTSPSAPPAPTESAAQVPPK